MRARPAKIIVLIVGGAVALGMWVFFAPMKLGGSTTYSITSGISMQPLLHNNDLAFVRSQSSYHVGDAVLYQSSVLHRPVLHRIILVQDGKYYFQGDNNDFVDPGYATRSELVGRLWFHIPKVGAVLGWFGAPFHAALLAGLATMLVVLAGVTTSRRRGRRRRGSPKVIPHSAVAANTSSPTRDVPSKAGASRQQKSGRRPPAYLEGPTWSLVSLAVALGLALLLLGVGFSQPVDRMAAQPGAYQQTGTFSYSATANAPNAVYPSGVVSTGEPIYPSLVDTVNLRFEYQFKSALPHHITGTVELRGLVLSQTDTWQQLASIVPVQNFTGDKKSVASDLPLSGLYELVDSVAVQSGIAGSNYSVDIQPVVHITGTVGHQPIKATFSPVLPFSATHTAIRIDVAAAPPPPGATSTASAAGAALASTLAPAQLGSVPQLVANELNVAKYKVPVPVVRVLGIVFAVLTLGIALLHDRLRRRMAKQSVEERIASQFHTLIVPVTSLGMLERLDAISVPDFAHLAGLARFLERPILYEVRDGSRTFAVDDDTRRYVTSAEDRRAGRARSDMRSSDSPSQPTPSDPPRRDPAPSETTASEATAQLKQASSAPGSRRRPVRSMIVRGAAGLLVLAVIGALTVSFTASTTVPMSRVGRSVQAGQVSQATPAGCASLALTSLVLGSGTFSSSSSHALILGTAGVDRITANGTFNCIVGGGGKDVVTSTASSVCIIGPTTGTTYTNCTKKLS